MGAHPHSTAPCSGPCSRRRGLADYSSFLAVPAALDFRAQYGDKAIMDYCHQQAVDGGSVLVAAWGTDKLVDDVMIAAMTNVRIPTNNATIAAGLGARLMSVYNTWCVNAAVCGVQPWVNTCIRNRVGCPSTRGRAPSTCASPLKSTTT